jgi:hypothetical protein
MKHSRTWLALLGLWLLTLACAAPEALSSAGASTAEASLAQSDALERRPPGPSRGPPPREPLRPGRGSRRRDRNPREPVFNAEPTPEQREAARRRSENAALETTLRAQYWRLKAEAERLYPDKVGRFEEHHFWPRYLGGPKNGRTFKLPAPYHQLITNAFRQRWEYGRSPPDPQVAQQIMMKVYADHPIPQLIGIPDP